MAKNVSRVSVGIIGCGTIGSVIAEYCAKELSEKIDLKALYDKDGSRAEALSKKLSVDTAIATSVDELIKSCALVIESASAAAVPEILKKAINAGKDIMVMSVGGLVADEDLIGLAKKSGSTLYIPSGAICGLDGVKAAAMKGIEEAILTTRKPPKGLKDAPYINKKAIDLDSLKSDKVIFDGTAQEAVREFPKNINVSAVLSLAGIGAKKTRVRIICSPGQKSNIHEIEVKGEFGKLTARTENVPSPNNPKTSFLAALSAIATLKGIVENIKIGT